MPVFEQAGRALPPVKLHPRRARRFAEATGTLAKTNRIDAAMLKPDLWPVKSEALAELFELIVAREGLVKDRTALANRAKNLALPMLKKQNEARRLLVVKQIKAIDEASTALINANPDVKAKYDQLIAAGKPAKLAITAITAIMRKLVVMANALLRENRIWAEIRP